jgi:hypothetical protein
MTSGPFRAVSGEEKNDRDILGHMKIQRPACGTDMEDMVPVLLKTQKIAWVR